MGIDSICSKLLKTVNLTKLRVKNHKKKSIFDQNLNSKNKEERYSRLPRLSDTRYSAKGTTGKWRHASSKSRFKYATYRR